MIICRIMPIAISLFLSALKSADRITELSDIQYNILIRGLRVQVLNYKSEPTYNGYPKKLFNKFRQGKVQNYLVNYAQTTELNYVESQILEGVTSLFPETFSRQEKFCLDNKAFLDNVISVFHREIQFYISYQDYISELKVAGLKFS